MRQLSVRWRRLYSELVAAMNGKNPAFGCCPQMPGIGGTIT